MIVGRRLDTGAPLTGRQERDEPDFAATDRWSPFMDAVFVYNISYSNLEAGWSERFVHSFSAWTNKRTNPVLWIAGLIGLIGLLCRLRTAATWAITAATLGAVVAACLPGKPWSHYFQLLTPWAVLSAALTCGWLAMIGRRRAYGLRPAAIYSVILMAAVLFYQVHYYLAVPPDQVAAIRYAGRDVWAMQHGWNVARVTDASDEIFVWGNDPGIYHYSERNSASRYTMVTALLGSGRGVSDRQDILMTELRTRRPRLILITARPFSALDAFVRAEYQAVGLDREPSPTNRIRMHVLCDPDRLIEPIQWSLDAPPR